MRARNLKPGFFKNEELADISMSGRLLFAGMWCLADRRGRLDDRPKKIKAELFPYDSINIEPLLNSLHKKRFIIRYAINGEKYIQIRTFEKHQNPHCREPESTIPAPCEHSANTVPNSAENGTGPADSPFSDSPFSDSPFSDCGGRSGAMSDDITPPSSAVPDPEFLRIPLISLNGDGKPQEFKVTESMVREWEGLFPALDVRQQLRNILAWNLANPRNRKTADGILRHITRWLKDDQNRARPRQKTLEELVREKGIDPDDHG
jgi:hypothetical protein